MEKKTHPTWDYFRLIAYVVVLIELFLLGLALIFGRVMGYEVALAVCLWIGVIVIAVFSSVVLLNFALILINSIYRRTRSR